MQNRRRLVASTHWLSRSGGPSDGVLWGAAEVELTSRGPRGAANLSTLLLLDALLEDVTWKHPEKGSSTDSVRRFRDPSLEQVLQMGGEIGHWRKCGAGKPDLRELIRLGFQADEGPGLCRAPVWRPLCKAGVPPVVLAWLPLPLCRHEAGLWSLTSGRSPSKVLQPDFPPRFRVEYPLQLKKWLKTGCQDAHRNGEHSSRKYH